MIANRSCRLQWAQLLRFLHGTAGARSSRDPSAGNGRGAQHTHCDPASSPQTKLPTGPMPHRTPEPANRTRRSILHSPRKAPALPLAACHFERCGRHRL
eukprot:5067630-Prymnesium_polylepis.1